jgi:VIT1/CCC1 family predicted Fe2+/Mn2+ transporter
MNKANPTLLQLSATRRGALDPLGRFSEVLFGLIMVLTFTGTISVAEAGEATVKTLLIAALGCNLAWGIVDAMMFVITRAVERARTQAIGYAIRAATDPEMARTYVREALSDTVNHLVDEKGLDRLVEKVRQYPPPQGVKWVTREDLKGALAVFSLVFLSTFPVVLPFLFVSEVRLAMRLSNGIAILLMFALGVSLARFSNQKFFTLGLAVVGIGLVLVFVTIALGG